MFFLQFLDAQASLAPTPVSRLEGWSVTHFDIFILLVSVGKLGSPGGFTSLFKLRKILTLD